MIFIVREQTDELKNSFQVFSISRYSPFYFTVILIPAMITTTEVDITTQGGSTTPSGSSIQGGSSTQAAGKTISCLNPIPIPDHNPLHW